MNKVGGSAVSHASSEAWPGWADSAVTVSCVGGWFCCWLIHLPGLPSMSLEGQCAG